MKKLGRPKKSHIRKLTRAERKITGLAGDCWMVDNDGIYINKTYRDNEGYEIHDCQLEISATVTLFKLLEDFWRKP
jgi:hypothetical protein